MRPLNAIIGILILTIFGLSCTDNRPNQKAIELTQVVSEQNIDSLKRLIETNHTEVRTALVASLNSYLNEKVKARIDHLDSLEQNLAWLCLSYQEMTGLSEYQRQFATYLIWDDKETTRKLYLDSIHLAKDSEYGRDRNNLAPEYLNFLSGLEQEYRELNDSFRVATTIKFRGNIFSSLNALDSAETELNRSLELCQSLDYISGAGECYYYLSRLYNYQRDDFHRGARLLVSAKDCFQQTSNSKMLGQALMDLGYTYLKDYQTEAARDNYQYSITEYERIGDIRNLSYCKATLAECFYDLGQLDSALELAHEALQLREELALKNRQFEKFVGYSLSQLGLFNQAKVQPELASAYFVKAAEIFETIDDTEGKRLNYLRQGNFFLDTKDYVKALDNYEWVISNNPTLEEMMLAKYGSALIEWNKGDTHQAKVTLRSVIQIIDTLRGRLPLPEMRTGYLSDKSGPYHLMTRIFTDEYLVENNSKLIDSILKYTEAGKARTLLELLYGDQQDLTSTQETEVNNAITHIDDSLLIGIGDSSSLNETRRQLVNHLHDIKVLATTSDSDQNNPDSSQLALNNLPELLEGEYQILIYHVSEFGNYLLSLSGDSVQLREIPISSNSLTQMVTEYTNAIGQYPGSQTAATDIDDLGSRLGSILMPPELLSASDKNRVIIIPTGILHRLPFEALKTEMNQYLVETYDISYAYSLASHLSLTSRTKSTDHPLDLIAIGAPAYDDSTIAPLPYSEDEITGLADLFDRSRVKLFTNIDATPKVLTQIDNSPSRFLHLATHAVTDNRYPDRSALILAPDRDDDNLRVLGATDIARLKLNSELVFLSCCKSGDGKLYAGEGPQSLAQPFLRAGARSVIVTHWNIDDRLSSIMAVDFYKALKKGESKAHALAEIKRKQLKSDRLLYRHPYFWAPYILIGPE